MGKGWTKQQTQRSSPNPDARAEAFFCWGKTFRRPATIPRDENLEANSRRRRKAQGGTEATTRSILELSAAALQSRWFSSLNRRRVE